MKKRWLVTWLATLMALLMAEAVHGEPSAESSAIREVVTQLKEFAKAIQTRNVQTIEQYAVFPLRIRYMEYADEVVVRRKVLKDAKSATKTGALVVDREALELLQKPGVHLADMQGDCDVSQLRMPRRKDGPAVIVKGDDAEISYLTNTCAVDTHIIVYKLHRAADKWQVVERDIRTW